MEQSEEVNEMDSFQSKTTSPVEKLIKWTVYRQEQEMEMPRHPGNLGWGSSKSPSTHYKVYDHTVP